jgi:hypothetical protein
MLFVKEWTEEREKEDSIAKKIYELKSCSQKKPVKQS